MPDLPKWGVAVLRHHDAEEAATFAQSAPGEDGRDEKAEARGKEGPDGVRVVHDRGRSRRVADSFPIHRVGQASKREENACEKRRARACLRDLPHEVHSVQCWLAPAAEEARIAHLEACAVVTACI